MAYIETRRQRYERMVSALDTERQSWISHWKDLNDYILPRRGRFFVTDRNRGDRRTQKIINSAATMAAGTLSAGLMGGMTSPSRPWLRLATPYPELNERASVKAWLHFVSKRMLEVFRRSNLYQALPTIYMDLGTFATAAAPIMEDIDVLRAYPLPVGSYMLGTNDRRLVDTIVREYQVTVRQLVMRHGDPMAGPDRRWANFSSYVKSAWDRGDYEQTVDVVHIIKPNEERDEYKLEARHKPWLSCYYERASDDRDKFLRLSGFDEFPGVVPRWHVDGEDVYGSSCPGMTALGDIRALQTLERRKAQAVEKGINPPLTGPSHLRNEKVSQIAGSITYSDEREGQKGLRAVHEVRFEMAHAMLDIQAHERRISRAFYEDLFLMLAMSDRREITAREVAERHEEKLLMLGPAYERQNKELLEPLIDRTFAIMLRRDMIPPAPVELEGMPLLVEYESIMASAMKLVGVGSLERFTGFVGQLMAGRPEAGDKVDWDQLVDEYGDLVGIPPHVIVPDDQVAAIRRQRAEAQARAEQAAAAEQWAKTGQAMSKADMEGDNALTRLAGGLQR